MHQLPYVPYDEEEFEPRVIPKPITKNDCITGPTVPEVSLIFEKRLTKNTSDGTTDYPSRERTRSRRSRNPQLFDNQGKSNPASSYSSSYAKWHHQNYSRDTTSSASKTCFLQSGSVYNDGQPLYTTSQNAKKPTEQNQTKNKGNKMLQTITKNDELYEKTLKFKCFDIEDSYDLEKIGSASDKIYLPSNSAQKAVLSITDHIVERPSVITNTLNKIDNCQIPHSGHQQLHMSNYSDTLKKPKHFETSYAGYQQVHVPNYSNCNMDSNETVKTLLQLVNSQNEQIKNLQLQVDRLIRLQEDNFKNKPVCLCSQPLANQVFRYPLNCYDTSIASSLAQSQNQGIKKNAASQNMTVVEKQDLENINKNNKSETGSEQQLTTAFMAKKVSIGVMTSCEFTVQNNPFLVDSEICEKEETYKEDNNVNKMNTHNTTELVNRYKNTYITRKPGPAQLENIVEDTESYLSSSQQQSSNFNASSSAKESSKMYQYPSTDLNREETHKDINTKKDSMNDKENVAKNTVNTPSNVNCSSIGSVNCNEVLPKQTNDGITMEGKRNYKTNTVDYSIRHMDLPMTDYYCNKNIEYSGDVKSVKNVDDSIILSRGDFKVLERPPPTPEPSIHIDMYEYTSDDESDKLGHTPKIGWTFYNNVLEQVNEILQNSGVISNEDQNHSKKTACNIEQENDIETKTALNTVKAATLEQLRRFGINLTENNEQKESNANKTSDFDSSFYPRLDHQVNVTQATSAANETNISMHMKALALKYLSDEQLADIASHKQESSSLNHLMLSNMQGTNMSLATRCYLERYKLLPRNNNVQAENTEQIYNKVLPKHAFKPAVVNNNNPALHCAPYRYPLVKPRSYLS